MSRLSFSPPSAAHRSLAGPSFQLPLVRGWISFASTAGCWSIFSLSVTSMLSFWVDCTTSGSSLTLWTLTVWSVGIRGVLLSLVSLVELTTSQVELSFLALSSHKVLRKRSLLAGVSGGTSLSWTVLSLGGMGTVRLGGFTTQSRLWVRLFTGGTYRELGVVKLPWIWVNSISQCLPPQRSLLLCCVCHFFKFLIKCCVCHISWVFSQLWKDQGVSNHRVPADN